MPGLPVTSLQAINGPTEHFACSSLKLLPGVLVARLALQRDLGPNRFGNATPAQHAHGPSAPYCALVHP